jgi:hypothetical protein
MYIECRHIFPSGKKCQSPALAEKEFCYFHHNKRNQKPRAYKSGEPSTLIHHLPQLEDVDTILTALSDVLVALAANRIDPRRAQILLYGLQVASQHSRRISHPSSIETVREAYEEADGTLVGPRLQALDTEDIHLDDEEEDEDNRPVTEEERRAYFGIRASAQPEDEADIPHIQAVADPPQLQPRHPERSVAKSKDPREQRSCVALRSKARLPQHKNEKGFPILTLNGVKGKGGKQEPQSAHKPCRTFPQSNQAPLQPPDPPLTPGQLRNYARKQILKALHSGKTRLDESPARSAQLGGSANQEE